MRKKDIELYDSDDCTTIIIDDDFRKLLALDSERQKKYGGKVEKTEKNNLWQKLKKLLSKKR